MVQNNYQLKFPQFAIQFAVNQAIEKLYGSQTWQARAVRQHRSLKIGSLEFIDYAVPCFELARTVKEDPNTIATKLAKLLTDENSIFASAAIGDATCEAVAGYVNVQLTNTYIERSAKTVLDWLKDPTPYESQQSGDAFLVIDPSMEQSIDYDVTRQAYAYIDGVYDLLKWRHSVTYVISDFSEAMLDGLNHAINKAGTGLRPIELRRRIKEFMSGHEGDGKSEVVQQEFQTLKAAAADRHQQFRDSDGVTRDTLLFESDMVDATNAFIDGLASETMPEQVIKDEASRAAYYVNAGEIMALRSSNGMLYSTAYMLYTLREQLMSAEQQGVATLVVLAPHRLHTVIIEFVRKVIETNKLRIRLVCFDAHASQADILQLQSSVVSIANHIAGVTKILERVWQPWLASSKTRQSLLSLLDLPMTLMQVVADTQLPALLDAISESVETITNLNS